MPKFKYVSLFSGIGGFETALNRLGGECVLASEIDKYANRAYKLLYGHETAGDVTQIDASLVPDHDILVGGFPCQSFSVAGKRLGFDDARGTLFFEAARIASVKQPSFVFMENVKGLISHDKGKTLETMLFVLNDIGYAVDFAVLNSKYFGVPQNRERIFIIGKRTDEHVPWDIPPGNDVVTKAKRKLADMGLRTFNFPYPTNNIVTTRLLDILEDNVDEKYYISDEKAAKLLEQLNDTYYQQSDMQMVGMLDVKGADCTRRVYSSLGISLTLTTMGGGNREPKIVVQDHGELRERMDGLSTCVDANYHKGIDNHGARTAVVEYSRQTGIGKELDVAHTLNASDWRGLNRNQMQNAVIEVRALTERRTDEAKQIRREYREKYGRDFSPRRGKELVERDDEVANTLTSTQTVEQWLVIKPTYRIRKLTPLECFRLQGFPDDYYYKLKSDGISDTQLYKLAGNAVTVPVIEAIGRELVHMLEETNTYQSLANENTTYIQPYM
ncbi:DNA (cytosine-5-)-methyltransferase [Alicyclobacillus acidoterrestris]|uniref:Cytosine-specific methyltransferase n=1 Tax=Alicyclobacillus acidoterrestris (strain ATCC 49025 / DSM 3922 / CIP 106132 / NCIMB 13137 / GD3B) TaxID=1356854 RepID=T0C3P3_ALIAG|nr:DNA (cytosine-5-)-methyltransferase [Alicyclobacillus acidoterrestris]EPZ47609.1 DNA methylase [Alicyclobacillus acidoterrestris ATCC 49025]UNO48004.1 DNA (cytosine-5-)-methyltransferase [Alicyclobacillus acidoterrestris]